MGVVKHIGKERFNADTEYTHFYKEHSLKLHSHLLDIFLVQSGLVIPFTVGQLKSHSNGEYEGCLFSII